MSSAHYNISASIQFAKDSDAFVKAISLSPKNEYLLKMDTQSKAIRENKLRYVYIDNGLFLPKDRPQQFFYIANPDGEIIACKKVQLSPRENEQDLLWFNSTNVLPEYQNNGLATALIRAAMQYADEHNYRIACSYFEDDGRKYLKEIYPRLHLYFPNLKISYARGPFVDGKEAYSINDDNHTIRYEDGRILSISRELTL